MCRQDPTPFAAARCSEWEPWPNSCLWQVPSSDTGSAASSGLQSTSALHTHKAVFSIAKGRRGAHKFGVSGVFWYPVDTGLFVTGSFDHDVKVTTLIS